MKYLTIIRHAKSSWDTPGLSDHDRPLNKRGNLAAPAVGRFLATTYFGKGGGTQIVVAPDQIVASTAARAVSTAEHMRAALGLERQHVLLASKLYLAEKQAILDVVRGLDENLVHCVIVGHNPGMHDFCDAILSRASIPKMPTCTAVMISLPHAYWGLADWSEAQLLAYVTPKALERRFPSEFAGISSTGDDD